jgi:anti-sigma factor RsiW
MHPSQAALLAFCDGEAGFDRSRRIEKHLAKCEKCRNRLARIRSEKDELSAGVAMPAMEGRRGLDDVLSAIANWRGSPAGPGASELRSRLRWQIEIYFGAPALRVVENPGMPAEELLGKASEIFDVFLGPAAAESVRDDVLAGLDSARPEAGR